MNKNNIKNNINKILLLVNFLQCIHCCQQLPPEGDSVLYSTVAEISWNHFYIGATQLIALIDSGEQCKLSQSHCQHHLITNATWTPLARKAIRLMHIQMPRTEGRLRRGCHIAAKTIRRSTVGAVERATVRHGHGHGNEEALREAHCA